MLLTCHQLSMDLTLLYATEGVQKLLPDLMLLPFCVSICFTFLSSQRALEANARAIEQCVLEVRKAGRASSLHFRGFSTILSAMAGLHRATFASSPELGQTQLSHNTEWGLWTLQYCNLLVISPPPKSTEFKFSL